MTSDELMTPLSPIESAELSNAAAVVLTVDGMNLLRRALMENDTYRANANAAKVEAYEDVLRMICDEQEMCFKRQNESEKDGLREMSWRWGIRGDYLWGIRQKIEKRRDAAAGRGK